jgi:quercetin dioxygenase-like cupin family protein
VVDKRPWEKQFSVDRIDIVEETPTLRVLEMTLQVGEKVPWHWHSAVNDRFYCLAGSVEIESRAPKAKHHLTPGDTCVMGPMVAHEVRNIGSDTARLVLVQGVGAYDYHAVGTVEDKA